MKSGCRRMKRSLAASLYHFLKKMVPGAGIEPARPLRTTDFKSARLSRKTQKLWQVRGNICTFRTLDVYYRQR